MCTLIGLGVFVVGFAIALLCGHFFINCIDWLTDDTTNAHWLLRSLIGLLLLVVVVMLLFCVNMTCVLLYTEAGQLGCYIIGH